MSGYVQLPGAMERGAFWMPKPQGWPLERVVSLLAGGAVVATLALGRTKSARWRLVTGFVGANLVLDAVVGWCPATVVLHQLGVRTVAERTRDEAVAGHGVG